MGPLECLGVASAVAAYGAFAGWSIVLAVIDARTHRLPNRIVLPAYPVAAVLLAVAAVLTGTAERLIWTLVGSLALFAFYLGLRMLRPGAMGGGDVKVAGVVGGFLGYLGLEWVLLGAAAGFVLGGVYAAILIASRRAGASTSLAFGPFLLAGAWAAIVAAVVVMT
jgi:leader peptidase (prepilin peptidase) / N-methyltransferase